MLNRLQKRKINLRLKNQRQQRGGRGEEVAVSFLQGKGWKIVARNFYLPRGGEIDIIAWDKETLVFVEVRSSEEQSRRVPLVETISATKVKALQRSAFYYLQQHCPQAPCPPLRFDLITVEREADSFFCRHYPNFIENCDFWENQ